MSDFLQKLAGALEVESVAETDDLKALPHWDSLAILSIIAMLDANYGVNLQATEIQQAPNAGALWATVQARKKT